MHVCAFASLLPSFKLLFVLDLKFCHLFWKPSWSTTQRLSCPSWGSQWEILASVTVSRLISHQTWSYCCACKRERYWACRHWTPAVVSRPFPCLSREQICQGLPAAEINYCTALSPLKISICLSTCVVISSSPVPYCVPSCQETLL